jgi:hypothetical protein
MAVRTQSPFVLSTLWSFVLILIGGTHLLWLRLKRRAADSHVRLHH